MNANTKTITKGATKAGKASKSKGIAVTPAWVFDANVYGQLGQEMATAAAQQTQSAVTYWDRCRTQYVAAQDHNQAQAAVDALFGPGEKVKGKKAPWYRTYKSLLSAACEHGIKVTNDMGMSALQKAIKEAKEVAADANEEASAEKDASMLEMFKRLAQGCLNRGISKKTLAEALKGLEA